MGRRVASAEDWEARVVARRVGGKWVARGSAGASRLQGRAGVLRGRGWQRQRRRGRRGRWGLRRGGVGAGGGGEEGGVRVLAGVRQTASRGEGREAMLGLLPTLWEASVACRDVRCVQTRSGASVPPFRPTPPPPLLRKARAGARAGTAAGVGAAARGPTGAEGSRRQGRARPGIASLTGLVGTLTGVAGSLTGVVAGNLAVSVEGRGAGEMRERGLVGRDGRRWVVRRQRGQRQAWLGTLGNQRGLERVHERRRQMRRGVGSWVGSPVAVGCRVVRRWLGQRALRKVCGLACRGRVTQFRKRGRRWWWMGLGRRVMHCAERMGRVGLESCPCGDCGVGERGLRAWRWVERVWERAWEVYGSLRLLWESVRRGVRRWGR